MISTRSVGCYWGINKEHGDNGRTLHRPGLAKCNNTYAGGVGKQSAEMLELSHVVKHSHDRCRALESAERRQIVRMGVEET
jgi:hypothetical protein